METVSDGKTITDIALLVAKGVAGVTSVAGITTFGVLTFQQSSCISSMRTAWEATQALLEDLKRPGIPVQQYFPKFIEDCGTQLDRILMEVDYLAKLWEQDPRRFGKFIRWLKPQKDCVNQAKTKLDELQILAETLKHSSREAYLLRAQGHPIPAPGEVLQPQTAKWPNVPTPAGGVERMSPSEHYAYRQAQGTFNHPPPPTSSGVRYTYAASQSSANVQSPTSASSAMHGWGPTLPGIPPAGETSLPYLPAQATSRRRRYNTAPVPVDYAHFDQLAATPYGTAVPTPATSPYGHVMPPGAPPRGMHQYPPPGARYE